MPSNYEIIKENRDFVRLYRRGRSCVDPLLVTYLSRNRLGKIRVGITATKKVGGAVERNRAKRVIRAALREQDFESIKGCDIVFVARTRTPLSKSTELAPIIQKHFERLLKPRPKKTDKSAENKKNTNA